MKVGLEGDLRICHRRTSAMQVEPGSGWVPMTGSACLTPAFYRLRWVSRRRFDPSSSPSASPSRPYGAASPGQPSSHRGSRRGDARPPSRRRRIRSRCGRSSDAIRRGGLPDCWQWQETCPLPHALLARAGRGLRCGNECSAIDVLRQKSTFQQCELHAYEAVAGSNMAVLLTVMRG